MSAQVKRCPDAWSQFEDNCYWVIQDRPGHSWLSAKTSCQTRGADLASMHSVEQARFIGVLMKDGASALTGGIISAETKKWT